jgi:hypothetical protein
MSAVFARLGHLVLVFALLGATGTHWVVLQSVAWATMLADNVGTAPLSAAIEKTFDGKHPCPLCKQIAVGRKSEKRELTLRLKKLEFPPAQEKLALASASRSEPLPLATPCPETPAQKPLVPPPRESLA